MARLGIFVSYSRHDEAIVRPIVKLLRLGNQAMVFLDTDSIEPGEPWRQRLDEALAQACYVVLFWCSHSHRSPEVEKEYRTALDTGKKVVPVLLDDTPLPPALAAYQWINFAALAAVAHAGPSADLWDALAAAPAVAGPGRAPAPPPMALDTQAPRLEPEVARAVLTLRVMALPNPEATWPLRAEFGPAGGTLGRADTSTLVLPDPKRVVSRCQAQVECVNGRFWLANTGVNALLVNDRPLQPGLRCRLKDGDELRVGDYLLAAGITVAGRAAPEPAARDAWRHGPAVPSPGWIGNSSDILPPADLLDTDAPVAPEALSAPPVPRPAGSRPLPPDFDPFGEPLPSPEPRVPRPAEADGIEVLFGLSPAGESFDPFVHGPPESVDREMARRIQAELDALARRDGLL